MQTKHIFKKTRTGTAPGPKRWYIACTCYKTKLDYSIKEPDNATSRCRRHKFSVNRAESRFCTIHLPLCERYTWRVTPNHLLKRGPLFLKSSDSDFISWRSIKKICISFVFRSFVDNRPLYTDKKSQYVRFLKKFIVNWVQEWVKI